MSHARIRRSLRHLAIGLFSAGTLFGTASGCDPAIRATIFGGFQDLATSFLDAVFLKLQQDDDGGIVTVRAFTPDQPGFRSLPATA